MQTIYTAGSVFTGNQFLADQAVIVSNEIITDILPLEWLPGNLSVTAHCDLMVPAFIDVQIYGARNKLFSLYPTADTLREMYAHCLEGGTAQFLPTIATNSPEIMLAGIEAVRQYWEEGGKGVIGLHLEGPWISVSRRGAHLEKYIQCATPIGVAHCIEKSAGIIKMITLAPELCNPEILNFLEDNNIVVSAGHSNATFDQATTAFSQGVTAVTHLFNAMSSFHHRDTGLPGAAFMHPSVMASIIADGIHVDFNTLAIAKKLMGERLFLITDAVTETTEGPYPHHLKKDRYESDGTLSGSALTMLEAVKNCILFAGIDPGEAFRMAGLYPARLLEIPGGRIQKEETARFLMLDGDYNLVGTPPTLSGFKP